MKTFDIRAISEDEARRMGARRLDCPPGEVEVSVPRTQSDGSQLWRVAQRGPDEDPADTIRRIEDEISHFESEAGAKGLDAGSLREKGYTGPGAVPLGRGEVAAPRRSSLVLEETVDVLVSAATGSLGDIPESEFDMLTAVPAGTEIAHRTLSAGETWPPAEAPQGYAELSNLHIRPEGTLLHLCAAVKGKVVLFQGYVYVIPVDRAGSCSMHVADDGMKAWCCIKPPRGAGKAVTQSDVKQALFHAGIVIGIRSADIEPGVAAGAVIGSEGKEFLIAEGARPINGRDAAADFSFDKSNSETEFTILSDGRIDYRKRSTILLVKKGELLATMNPPSPGIDGQDVKGAAIPHEPGEPKSIVCGENVITDPQEQHFYATDDGQVQLNGNIISVHKHFFVPGDVDFRTGNINFPGNVTINGSVQTGFEVIAVGDIVIMGDIDAARLVKAGRDLTVGRGVIGGAGTLVQCGRNFIAAHLQNAVIEAEGDVHVRNSCMHSMVGCAGKFLMDEGRGTVIGGEVNARAGIVARVVGSVTGTKTSIIAGQDFLVMQKIRELDTAIAFFTASTEKIEAFLRPINESMHRHQTIDDSQKQRLQMIFEKRRGLLKDLSIMQAKRRSLSLLALAQDPVDIRIQNDLYPDVRIVIKDQVFTSAQLFQRCRFYIDESLGTIQKASL